VIGDYELGSGMASLAPPVSNEAYGFAPLAESFTGAISYKEGLPPLDVRLLNAQHDKIPTPINDLGLIDVDQLIVDVNRTIAPGYTWPSPPSRHHIYWPRTDYVEFQEDQPEVPAVRFREQSAHLIRVPREFENWLHAITEPPPMPEPEVMEQVNAAWTVAQGLFHSIRETTKTVRMFERARGYREFSEAQEEIIHDMVSNDLAGVVTHLYKLDEIPVEFWPFSPDVQAQIAAGQIGEIMTKGWLRKTRAANQRDAA
jgi:hypothetical protein